MRVLMITSEASPLAKTGGLGDILGSLPEFLNQNGLDSKILMPAYRKLDRRKLKHIRYYASSLQLGSTLYKYSIEETIIEGPGTPCYLIHCNELYDRDDIYGPRGGSYSDNDIRYAFQCKVALEIKSITGWEPEIFHCHDWGAALVPAYQKILPDKDPQKHIPSVLTIHSLEHQGHFDRSALDRIGLPFYLFNPERIANHNSISFMESGLCWASKITTVSPTYAREIQTPEYGFGLHTHLQSRSHDILGILNGIREYEWDPKIDVEICSHFDANNLDGKKLCKSDLQKITKLPQSEETPLIGCVSRLFSQKGMDCFGQEIPELLKKQDFQFVLLGSGDPSQEDLYKDLQKQYPQNISIHIEFDTTLAHKIMAGSDLFMMPSRYEPCGLSQIYAMRYGALPIVRSTGGLRDTVISGDYKSEATGFHFPDLSSDSIQIATLEAIRVFKHNPDTFLVMQKRAMSQDFSWTQSATDYEKLYSALLST